MDNAATTKVAPGVYEAMKPYFEEYYGNAASIYRFAGESRKAVEHAREVVANFIGANINEIYFTGGGSESDNWALIGTAFSLRDKGNHIIAQLSDSLPPPVKKLKLTYSVSKQFFVVVLLNWLKWASKLLLKLVMLQKWRTSNVYTNLN